MGKKDEVVAMEVEAPVVAEKKKKKKSKRTAEEEHEDAPKSKKQKKSEEAAVEEPAAEEGEKKKKKKKKSKDAEAPAAEEPAAEEGEKKEKKKKSKVVEEEKAEEPTADSDKEEEKKEAEVVEKAEEPAAEVEAKTEVLSVFIGGLPWSADEETVKKDFGECGEITGFRMLTDRETGQPKGNAFCDFATTEAVKKALEFNETEYGGRTIYVREVNDEPKGGKKGKGKKGGKKGGKGEPRVPGEKPDGCKSLIVKNMSYDTTEDALWKLFEGCGDIERLKLLTDRETGASKGIAFVDFAEEAGVDAGIKKCNEEVDGRQVFVDYSGGADKGGKKGKDGKKGDGKKGGKGKGKDGKKGGKGKGKKGAPDAVRSANQGSIVESTGKTMAFDSDSD